MKIDPFMMVNNVLIQLKFLLSFALLSSTSLSGMIYIYIFFYFLKKMAVYSIFCFTHVELTIMYMHRSRVINSRKRFSESICNYAWYEIGTFQMRVGRKKENNRKQKLYFSESLKVKMPTNNEH
jgi:hypothetical protein